MVPILFTLMLHKQRADDVIYVIILKSCIHITGFSEKPTHSEILENGIFGVLFTLRESR
jgi:hypothetical protein